LAANCWTLPTLLASLSVYCLKDIMIISYNSGCGAGAGAGLPPNPVTT